MATINVKRETSIAFYGKITLGELRAFLKACDGIPDGASVRITSHSDQREGSSATIKVADVPPPREPYYEPYDR